MKSKMIKFLMVTAMLIGGSFLAMENIQAAGVTQSFACAVNIGAFGMGKPGGCADGSIDACMAYYTAGSDDAANYKTFAAKNPNCNAAFRKACLATNCTNDETYCQYAVSKCAAPAPAPAPASGPCDSPCSARSDRTACVAAVKADSSTETGDACKAYLCGFPANGKKQFQAWADANC